MIVVVAGPGGVGKGTVVARLVQVDAKLVLSRSWTTRPPRPGEGPEHYTFVDRAPFVAHLEAGGFLEHDEYLGNLYGTPVPFELGEARDLLLEINVPGVEQVRAMRPDALVILLAAPDDATLEARLRHRGDDDAHVAARLAIAKDEHDRLVSLADAVVVNDDLDRTVAAVAAVIAAARA